MSTQRDPEPIAIVSCGAIAREIKELVKRQGWKADVTVLPASYHMEPHRILREVEARIRDLRGYQRVIVGYGACGIHDFDQMLARYGAVRIPGPHCYEMLAGEAFEQMMAAECGTFFLTDFLVKAWDQLVAKWWHLKDRPQLKRALFRHYTRVIFLNTHAHPSLDSKAQTIADDLELPLEIRRVEYGDLEKRLVNLVEGAPSPLGDEHPEEHHERI